MLKYDFYINLIEGVQVYRFMNDDHFVEKKAEIEKTIELLKEELSQAPSGTIVALNKNGHYRWYHQKKNKKGGFERKYLNKKDEELARKLAKKAYAKALLRDKENELSCIKAYLKRRKCTDYRALIEGNSPYRSLILCDDWGSESYESSHSHPENLIVKAPKGQYVRSKSEALIANELFEQGISYRYECLLDIGGIAFYPDFTIRKDATGEIFIWEHFGLVDDAAYFDNMMRKMSLYMKNGYIPGVNLIMTFETRRHPLTIDDVRKVIAHYLK
ncbi:hypothetical protein [Butyrivibrio sp.]|uniref:hypothetical protein n=1 Tax=Butyrivibrio sp. TaxID=28121 RepID=UPI0025C5B95F|nr:hypothetical protein [Butyrivibrio sp.]